MFHFHGPMVTAAECETVGRRNRRGVRAENDDDNDDKSTRRERKAREGARRKETQTLFGWAQAIKKFNYVLK